MLITRGGTGIGLRFAIRFLAAGSTIWITGSDIEKLEMAGKDFPGLKIYVGDIGDALKREALSKFISETIPDLNVLINNAGFQRRVSLREQR